MRIMALLALFCAYILLVRWLIRRTFERYYGD